MFNIKNLHSVASSLTHLDKAEQKERLLQFISADYADATVKLSNFDMKLGNSAFISHTLFGSGAKEQLLT